MQLIVPVYLRSLKKHQIMKALVIMGLTRLKDLTAQFTAFQPSTMCTDQCDMASISEQLSTYGLTFASIPPNGDCFFTAVATNLISDLHTWKHLLNLIGVTSDVHATLETLAGILRQTFMQELGERHSHYENFVAYTDMDYTA